MKSKFCDHMGKLAFDCLPVTARDLLHLCGQSSVIPEPDHEIKD